MWCGSQTEKTVVSVPFNCLVEPKGCKPETKFLSSGSEQIIIIIIIIKEAGTDSDKVGQSCHSHCIVPLIFTLTRLSVDSSPFSACQWRECLKFSIILHLFQERNRNKYHFKANDILTREFSLLLRESLKEIWAPGSGPLVDFRVQLLSRLSLHCLIRYDLGIPYTNMLHSCTKGSPTANLSIRNSTASTLSFSLSEKLSWESQIQISSLQVYSTVNEQWVETFVCFCNVRCSFTPVHLPIKSIAKIYFCFRTCSAVRLIKVKLGYGHHNPLISSRGMQMVCLEESSG